MNKKMHWDKLADCEFARSLYPWLRLLMVCAAGITLLSGCVQIIPGPPQAPPGVLSGREELKKHNVARARQQFDAAIGKDRTNRLTYIAIMQSCLETGQQGLVVDYFRQAEAALAKTKGEERAQFYVAASIYLESAGDGLDSVRACEEAYRLLPQAWETQNALGYTYAQSGKNLERAIELTTSAIKKAREERIPDKELGIIVDSLGWAYYRNEQLAEAVRTLSSAADLSPDQPEVLYHLGVAYFDSGDYKDAKISLTRAKAGTLDAKNMDPVALAKLQTAIEQQTKKVEEKLALAKPAPAQNAPGPGGQ